MINNFKKNHNYAPKHVVLSSEGTGLPEGQSEHLSWPKLFWNCPSGQILHSSPILEYVPGGHGTEKYTKEL